MPFGAFVDVGAMASQRSIRWKSGKGGTDVFFVFTLQPPCWDNVGMLQGCLTYVLICVENKGFRCARV